MPKRLPAGAAFGATFYVFSLSRNTSLGVKCPKVGLSRPGGKACHYPQMLRSTVLPWFSVSLQCELCRSIVPPTRETIWRIVIEQLPLLAGWYAVSVPKSLQSPSGFPEFLQDLKGRIRTAQVRAAFAVSRELVLLYWSIGRDLSQRFVTEKWGGKIVERLAHDLQAEFPGVEGFSPRNLRYMRSLAEAWPEPEILQQLIAKLPWGHNLRVLDRIKDRSTREWYLRAALEFGWSQDVLVLQIKSRLHEREGKALTNFQRALPPA